MQNAQKERAYSMKRLTDRLLNKRSLSIYFVLASIALLWAYVDPNYARPLAECQKNMLLALGSLDHASDKANYALINNDRVLDQLDNSRSSVTMQEYKDFFHLTRLRNFDFTPDLYFPSLPLGNLVQVAACELNRSQIKATTSDLEKKSDALLNVNSLLNYLATPKR